MSNTEGYPFQLRRPLSAFATFLFFDSFIDLVQ